MENKNRQYDGIPFKDADEIPEEGNKTLHQLMTDYREGKITAEQYQNLVAEQIAKEEVSED